KAANRPIAPPPLGGSGTQALAVGSTPGTQYAQETVQPGTPLSQIDSAYAALFPRVGFWWRTLATLIDFILVALVSSVSNAPGPLIPLFIYFIVFWGWKGSTLGGMALGLRVQKISGEPLDWSTSIVRSLSSIVSFLPLCLGFFWAGWDPENQSWHDKIAGTTVVRIPKGYTWS
ncbi:MAG: RDD family protein, partial [Verrucomicrobia bacterium]|nr:RDD family protein [Verrucomicrobiota bacterium]